MNTHQWGTWFNEDDGMFGWECRTCGREDSGFDAVGDAEHHGMDHAADLARADA